LLTAVPARAGTASTPAPSRSLYRIPPAKAGIIGAFLSAGIDVAGTGSDGSLHVFLDAGELAAARALGLAPEPLATRGPHGAAGVATVPPNLGDYHTFAETVSEMTSYVSSHASIARLDTIGVSVQGRPLLGVKISDNVATEENEPEVLIVGCHHARELMSVEIPLYVMRRLLDGYGVDPLLTSLVNTREIWIVPMVNPDGHVYVENNSGGQSENWWRKNRRANGDGSFGVDLNRNYAYNWGLDNIGSSGTPSSDVYRGTAPFSEPETAALRDFIAHHAFTVSASFHSYGDLFLYPWGFARANTPDHPVFQAFGDSVSLQNGYRAGNPENGAIYITNGDMDDWLYGDNVTKPRTFGFTFEVNTFEEGGFFPNDALIPSTCTENWGPTLTLLRYADEPRRIKIPARTSKPDFLTSGGSATLSWTVPVPDPANQPVDHEVRQIASVSTVTDNAESGIADWDTLKFTWSAARSASATHSYYSGAGNDRESILTGRGLIAAGAGDSLVASAYWDLENFYDYWYAEASADGGATWESLAGDRTTMADPFGNNQGNGITASSGGTFLRSAFSLEPYAGQQVLVRFRVVTDNTNFGEGLYLDDVTPTIRYSGATITPTGSTAATFVVTPAPATPVWFQVRAVDSEGQRGAWSDRASYDPNVTAVSDLPVATADWLAAPSPNPFNPRTRIRFRIGAGASGRYRLAIYDVAGRLVSVAAEGRDGGLGLSRSIDWTGKDSAGRDLPSGVYLLRLETPRGALDRKMTLLR
jgi:hypothetical protein